MQKAGTAGLCLSRQPAIKPTRYVFFNNSTQAFSEDNINTLDILY